jgi:hypothetical protein
VTILAAIPTANRKLGVVTRDYMVNKHLKLDKPLGFNLMSTEPRPIKVTRTAAKTIRGEEKAIENAKIGKVSAVVAVMYLDGESKVNLQNANSQKKEILIGTKAPSEHSKRLTTLV